MRMKERNGVATSCSKLFTIDKTRWGTLCDQIADGFRNAIAAGVYKPGDMLPQMRDLAVHFDVSIRVVVRAFAKLADEQLVVGRPRVGCHVLAPRSSIWKGLVILVIPNGNYVYNQNIRVGRVSDRLTKEGYMVQRVYVPAVSPGVYDFRCLDLQLRQSASLVVVFDGEAAMGPHLAAMNVRFVVAGNWDKVKIASAGLAYVNIKPALDGLAAHVKSAGIGSVVLVGAPRTAMHAHLLKVLRKTGACVREWKICTGVGVTSRISDIQARTRDFFRKRLSGGMKLPDLFVFVDEYRAMGGALALYEAGVRIPEDVKIVSVANVGNGPVRSCEAESLA